MVIYANINCAVFFHQSHLITVYAAIFVQHIRNTRLQNGLNCGRS